MKTKKIYEKPTIKHEKVMEFDVLWSSGSPDNFISDETGGIFERGEE